MLPWDGAAKLLWLRVRLTGRAQTAYKQLSEEARAAYADCKKALRERFEPASKKELYLAEFQTRSKRVSEGWAAFAEDLKVLVNRAFPQLQNDAREQLALSHYLGQLTDHQIAFNVRQKCPQTLDDAVSATLELESYLLPHRSAPSTESSVSQVVAGVHQSQDMMMQMLTKMMARLDRLESDREAKQRGEDSTSKKPVVCHICGIEGHFARGCAVRRSQSTES